MNHSRLTRNKTLACSEAELKRSLNKFSSRNCDKVLKDDKRVKLYNTTTNLFENQLIQSGLNVFEIKFDNNAQYDYYLNQKTHILQTSFYELAKIRHKKTKETKITKIINRESLKLEKRFRNRLEIELKLHSNLKNSDSILKLEEVFETDKEIFLIYENGDFLLENLSNISQYYSKNEIEDILADVMIGIAEINSFGYSTVCLDSSMVISVIDETTEEKKIKIFNFPYITKYGNLPLPFNPKVYPKEFIPDDRYVNANNKTDSWTFGIFMLHCLRGLSKSMIGGPKICKDIIRSVINVNSLDQIERDLVKRCIGIDQHGFFKQERWRMKDLYKHHFFVKMYKYNSEYKARIEREVKEGVKTLKFFEINKKESSRTNSPNKKKAQTWIRDKTISLNYGSPSDKKNRRKILGFKRSNTISKARYAPNKGKRNSHFHPKTPKSKTLTSILS